MLQCAETSACARPQTPVDAQVEKVMCSGSTSYFLYLATWNMPRMFRNVKHL